MYSARRNFLRGGTRRGRLDYTLVHDDAKGHLTKVHDTEVHDDSEEVEEVAAMIRRR